MGKNPDRSDIRCGVGTASINSPFKKFYWKGKAQEKE
jgi:hypothetical protein